ncbi:MAG: MarC family protein [Verrucomicrobiales bacterium]|nr:MarC family protein [Verrucomicrobiales bacterium]
MNPLLGHVLSVFMGFFAIMNPIANTPIFLGLTSDDSVEVRKKVARKSVLTAFVLILIFTLMGRLIFSLFGITLPAFRIMGGVLVAIIGYQMMHGSASPVHAHQSGEDGQDLEAALSVAVTPLAIPILAGPGTIATAMSFASEGGLLEMAITVGAFAVLCGITYLAFIYGERLVRYLGQSGLSVVTRIMGLILGVIGVQMLIEGVKGAVESLGK